MAIRIEDLSSREINAIECPKDHGFCGLVDGTKEEQEEVGCYVKDCCNAAFVCKICGERYYTSLPAPDIDWD